MSFTSDNHTRLGLTVSLRACVSCVLKYMTSIPVLKPNPTTSLRSSVKSCYLFKSIRHIFSWIGTDRDTRACASETYCIFTRLDARRNTSGLEIGPTMVGLLPRNLCYSCWYGTRYLEKSYGDEWYSLPYSFPSCVEEKRVINWLSWTKKICIVTCTINKKINK